MKTKVAERMRARKLRATGKSLNEIVRLLRVSKSSVSIWVRDVQLTSQQRLQLKERERSGAERGRKAFVSRWAAYRILHPKPIKGPRWPQRSVEEFFDTWTSEMAYVLGYFAADGTMYRNKRGSCYVGFTSTDLELVETVKRIMNTTNAIEEYQSRFDHHKRRYTLQIGSKKIYKRLQELGFTPNKSLTLRFPPVPDNVIAHFIRGYFDGDGCITIGRYKLTGKQIVHASFVSGSKKFLAVAQRRLSETGTMGKGSLYSHGKTAYMLRYGKNDARQLYKFMYPTNVPHLGRKKQRFEEIFEKGPVA